MGASWAEGSDDSGNRIGAAYLISFTDPEFSGGNLADFPGATSNIQGTDFGSNVDQHQVRSFEGDSTSLTVSGRLQ